MAERPRPGDPASEGDRSRRLIKSMTEHGFVVSSEGLEKVPHWKEAVVRTTAPKFQALAKVGVLTVLAGLGDYARENGRDASAITRLPLFSEGRNAFNVNDDIFRAIPGRFPSSISSLADEQVVAVRAGCYLVELAKTASAFNALKGEERNQVTHTCDILEPFSNDVFGMSATLKLLTMSSFPGELFLTAHGESGTSRDTDISVRYAAGKPGEHSSATVNVTSTCREIDTMPSSLNYLSGATEAMKHVILNS